MDEQADFIASLAQAAEIEKQILDGAFAPMVTVLLPIPLELKEILIKIENNKAYNLIEFSIRYILPIIVRKPLEQFRVADPLLLAKDYLEMYITYSKLLDLHPYIKTLAAAAVDLSTRLSKELSKYDLDNTMVTLAISKDKPLNKFIEVMIYGNYTDPETGEWIHYA